MAKLAGGVAVIKGQRPTEVEMKEKKARVDDALHATRAAVEEGIVAGGGVGAAHASPRWKPRGRQHDQDAGIKIVLPRRRAAAAPDRRERRRRRGRGRRQGAGIGKGGYGFNAANDTYGDMFEMGILDPTKVTRTALQNATSVAAC